jgi:hypothetical protein
MPTRRTLALSETTAALALLVLGSACAALLLAQERHVAPLELPSISLPAEPVQSVMRADAEAARLAPRDARATELEGLLIAQGEAEARGTEDASAYGNRRRALDLVHRALVAESSEAAALRLRARAVEELDAALQMRLPKARAKAVLGAMTTVFAREGVSRNGYLVAPLFVVRTLYKARWNLLVGTTADHAFEQVEKRAFYGWQALHTERVPLRDKIAALHEYAKAGGDHVEEALGVLLFRFGDYAQAANALQTAYGKQHSVRLRNYVLGARLAAGYDD